MESSEKTEKLEKSNTNEGFLLFLCFSASAFFGYFLTHYMALLGA
jgi:hypothetical protein